MGMAERSQQAPDNLYVRVLSSPDSDRLGELETQNNLERPNRLASFCQTALWVLAGSSLIGFAVCVLWWDPVTCDQPGVGHRQLTYTTARTKVIHLAGGDAIQQEECNPFYEKGYLHYNATDPGDNTWRPYNEDCQPSNLYGQLKKDLQGGAKLESGEHDFEWLRNRTVVLIGDSIDRFHNLDFCQMLSWAPGSTEARPIELQTPPTKTYHIGADSPLSPPPWHFHPEDPLKPPSDWPSDEEELFKFQTPIWDSGKINAPTTRPRVCEIPKYGFTMISLFNWGLDPKEGGRLYANISGYFPPAEYTSRVEHILKPVLKNLATHLDNPLIMKPDLIEMGSGLWDTRQWAEEDYKLAGKKPDPRSSIAFDDLSPDRLAWWTERQKRAIKWVAQAFPELETPILWRSLHHVQHHYWVAYNRVFQLDQLARHNIEELKERDLILDARLRMDEWGALMLGQEHHFRDVLHVAALPGGALWGDVMLWELRRAVKKRGYTYYKP